MKIMLFVLCILPALYIQTILRTLVFLIFGPMFGTRLKEVSFLRLDLKHSDDGWKISKGDYTPIIQVRIVPETRKPHNKKAEFLLIVILFAVQTGAAAAICLTAYSVFGMHFGYAAAALYGFGFGMAFFAVSNIVILIYVLVSSASPANKYLDSLFQRLRNGESYSSLDVKPLEQLGFRNVSELDKKRHYNIYMGYLAAIGDYESMRVPSHRMMDKLIGLEFLKSDAAVYNNLLFFFSEVEPNREFADMIFNKMEKTITADTDPNGRRVMAYYAFGIYNDIAGAERFLSEGYAALSEWTGTLASSAELEKELLDRLSSRIAQAKTASQPFFNSRDNRIM